MADQIPLNKKDLIANLRVIAYDAEVLGRQIPAGDSRWFQAEACGRHVLFTFDPSAEIPTKLTQSVSKQPLDSLKHRRATRVLAGEDAYAFLLMVATGLLDQDQGNETAKTSMKLNFDSHEMIPKSVSVFMRDVLFDANYIAANVLRDPQGGSKVITSSEEPATVVRRMMPTKQQCAHQKLLIVGEKDQITQTTFEILARKYNDITLTNPNADQLKENLAACERVAKDKSIKTTIHSLDAVSLSAEELSGYSAVVVCSAMGSAPQFEKQLLDQWLSFPEGKTSLIHLRGVPQMRGKTQGEWERAQGKEGFIDREAIEVARSSQRDHSAATISGAFNACRNCAKNRASGKKHDANTISLSTDSNTFSPAKSFIDLTKRGGINNEAHCL